MEPGHPHQANYSYPPIEAMATHRTLRKQLFEARIKALQLLAAGPTTRSTRATLALTHYLERKLRRLEEELPKAWVEASRRPAFNLLEWQQEEQKSWEERKAGRGELERGCRSKGAPNLPGLPATASPYLVTKELQVEVTMVKGLEEEATTAKMSRWSDRHRALTW